MAATDLFVPTTLPAITVHQPFALALALGLKPVENRVWRPPPRHVGGELAIHAGAKWSEEGVRGLVGSWFRHGLWNGRALEEFSTVGAVVKACDESRSAVLAVGVIDSVAPTNDMRPRLDESRMCPGPCGRTLRDCRGEQPQVVCIRGVWLCSSCYDGGFEPSEFARVAAGADTFERWRLPDTYGWMIRDVVRLARPVPAKGRERIWSLNIHTDERVRAQLARSTR